jgi:hypothetical protein
VLSHLDKVKQTNKQLNKQNELENKQIKGAKQKKINCQTERKDQTDKRTEPLVPNHLSPNSFRTCEHIFKEREKKYIFLLDKQL